MNALGRDDGSWEQRAHARVARGIALYRATYNYRAGRLSRQLWRSLLTTSTNPNIGTFNVGEQENMVILRLFPEDLLHLLPLLPFTLRPALSPNVSSRARQAKLTAQPKPWIPHVSVRVVLPLHNSLTRNNRKNTEGKEVTHPNKRIDDQHRPSQRPRILDLRRERFRELALTPLEDDEEFGGDGGE